MVILCVMIDANFDVMADHLLYKMRLDDSQAQMLDKTLGHIGTNLETMRKQEAQFSDHALKELARAAAARMARPEANAEKAKGMGFPVD
jgi:hypothetical protein